MPKNEQSSEVDRISAAPGTNEYERQFGLQSSSAIQRLAGMVPVRVVCGLLTLAYCLMVAAGSVIFLRSQIAEGFHIWEILLHVAYLVLMWWVISMQGRIALYGEFSTEIGLFAPRPSRT